MSRNTIIYYLPTKRWNRRQVPTSKTEILLWYKEQRRLLESRKKKSIWTEIEVVVVEVDRKTKEIVKKAKSPKKIKIQKHKLSVKDADTYLGLLEKRFENFKQEYNRKVKEKRK